MKFDYHSEYQRYRKYIQNLIVESIKKPAAVTSLALVATIFFTSILAVFALHPTLTTIGSLIREIRDEKETIQALDNKITSLKQAQQILQHLESRLYLLENAVPKSPSLEKFVKQIEIIASRNKIVSLEFSQKDLTLKSSSPSAVRKTGFSSLLIAITAGGDESSLRSFISDLESLGRIAVIKSADLSTVDSKDRDKHPYPLNVTINLEIYYQKI